MTTAITIMVIPILSICPTERTVLMTADATPKYLGTTELMTALVLGEEKRAKPTPSTTRVAMISAIGVAADRKLKKRRQQKIRAIPAEATILGSILSDNFQVKGERAACMMGCNIKTSPAVSGVRPLISCK